MGFQDQMRVSAELRQRKALLENQRTALEGLYLAAQQLWDDEELRPRCDSLLKVVARALVENVARMWELCPPRHGDLGFVAPKGEGGRDETLPW